MSCKRFSTRWTTAALLTTWAMGCGSDGSTSAVDAAPGDARIDGGPVMNVTPVTAPSGCAAALTARTSGVARCTPEAACAQIKAQPERQVSFVFDLHVTRPTPATPGPDEELPPALTRANWQCIVEFLRASGVTVFEPHRTDQEVIVAATFPQVHRVFGMAIVNSIEVGCHTEGMCAHCAFLSPERCADDAFCAVIGGAPIIASNQCAGPAKPVGCMTADSGCGDSISHARDPQGNCWQFSSTCIPDGWDAEACQPPPDRGSFDACP